MGSLILCVVSACGSDAELGTATTMVDGKPLFEIEVPDCDDEGACEETFFIDGIEYAHSCQPIPESDLGDRLAIGGEGLSVLEARRIKGEDPSARVALRMAAEGCNTWVDSHALARS